MTDVEILMEVFDFDVQVAFSQLSEYENEHKACIKAYRAGYEKGASDYHEGFEAGVAWGRKYDDDGLDSMGH